VCERRRQDADETSSARSLIVLRNSWSGGDDCRFNK